MRDYTLLSESLLRLKTNLEAYARTGQPMPADIVTLAVHHVDVMHTLAQLLEQQNHELRALFADHAAETREGRLQ